MNLLLEGEEIYTYSVKDDCEEKLLCISKVKHDESGRLVIQTGNSKDINVGTAEEVERIILNFIRKGTSYKVMSLVDVEGGSRIVLREIQNIEKVRLRKYVRVDTKLDYQVYSCDVNGNPTTQLPVEKFHTVNISGGGFLFFAKTPVSISCRLYIKLDLPPDCGVITTFGKVVRCQPVRNCPDTYGIAVEFVEISERNREKIFSYVLHVQREQIKLGVFTESDQ